MFKIDGTTIKINRGDIMNFKFSIPLETGENHKFKVGDVLSFGVFGKKEMDELPLLYKEFIVEEEDTEKVSMSFTSEEMKFGELINKPTDYWYEIQLNGKQTVLGYDDVTGAKIIRLYPEGRVLE